VRGLPACGTVREGLGGRGGAVPHVDHRNPRGAGRHRSHPALGPAHKEFQMDSPRKTALVVGVLFILTFVTSIAGALAYGPVLSDPNYVNGAGADTRVFV